VAEPYSGTVRPAALLHHHPRLDPDDLRHTHDLGRKEAAHTRCSDSGSKGFQDLIPQRDESDWAGTANAVTSVSAGHGADLWAWLDLNQ
jgi:hypothetical protein